jgi:hypothetical protein
MFSYHFKGNIYSFLVWSWKLLVSFGIFLFCKKQVGKAFKISNDIFCENFALWKSFTKMKCLYQNIYYICIYWWCAIHSNNFQDQTKNEYIYTQRKKLSTPMFFWNDKWYDKYHEITDQIISRTQWALKLISSFYWHMFKPFECYFRNVSCTLH